MIERRKGGRAGGVGRRPPPSFNLPLPSGTPGSSTARLPTTPCVFAHCAHPSLTPRPPSLLTFPLPPPTLSSGDSGDEGGGPPYPRQPPGPPPDPPGAFATVGAMGAGALGAAAVAAAGVAAVFQLAGAVARGAGKGKGLQQEDGEGGGEKV